MPLTSRNQRLHLDRKAAIEQGQSVEVSDPRLDQDPRFLFLSHKAGRNLRTLMDIEKEGFCYLKRIRGQNCVSNQRQHPGRISNRLKRPQWKAIYFVSDPSKVRFESLLSADLNHLHPRFGEEPPQTLVTQRPRASARGKAGGVLVDRGEGAGAGEPATLQGGDRWQRS